MSLMDKLKKNSTVKSSAVLIESKYFMARDSIPTAIPAMNIALSGSLNGGFLPGITLWCGPSKHGKSLFSLIMAKAYMDKYPDAVMIFYDCEFGMPEAYFKALDIDMSRVLHVPIMNMEEFKFDIMQQLQGLTRGDHAVIVVDSLGNLASKKEMEDALEGKSVADMSRAKQMKSIFRMVTPYLNHLDIPLIGVNHIYMEQGLYPKAIVSGGSGIYLSADNIFIMGRQQDKGADGLEGFNFVINVEKSRHTREKSKIPINVRYDSGISKWSGLLEIALDSGTVIKPSNGWYSRVLDGGEIEAKKWRAKDTDCSEFWDPLLKGTQFPKWIEENFMVSSGKMMIDEDTSESLSDHDDA